MKTWKTIDGKKYYFGDTGVAGSGARKIDGVLWFFDTETKALRVGKAGFAKDSDGSYYVKKSGKIATGWQAINKRAYYFSKKTGVQVKGKSVHYLKIPKKGYLGRAYDDGVKTLNKNGWSLKAAYKFSYKLTYYDRWYRTKSAEKYSYRGFEKKHGNCYVMAATFYVQAELLGYRVRMVQGKIGYWPHCWTQIKHGKKWYVYDPNFRNETHRSGWKIYYGKPGTWRYSHKKVFQEAEQPEPVAASLECPFFRGLPAEFRAEPANFSAESAVEFQG